MCDGIISFKTCWFMLHSTVTLLIGRIQDVGISEGEAARRMTALGVRTVAGRSAMVAKYCSQFSNNWLLEY